jgi:hypothetical protein
MISVGIEDCLSVVFHYELSRIALRIFGFIPLIAGGIGLVLGLAGLLHGTERR